MIADKSLISEYPFSGIFSRISIDESSPLEQREETEIVLLETECDIQEVSSTDGNAVNNVTFNVYFPFDTEDGVNIRRGDKFVGNMYGIEVKGEVDGIFPTQLGGCEVHLKDYTV